MSKFDIVGGAYSQINNINWKFTPCKEMSASQLNHVLDVLEKNGYKRLFPREGKKCVTLRSKLWNTYQVISRTKYDVTLLVYLVNEETYRPIRYTTRYSSGVKEKTISGKQAFDRVNRMAKARGTTIDETFGSDHGKNYFWKIKKCVPSPLTYANNDYTEMVLDSIQKADVSSAWPWEASKTLPTLRGAIEVDGRVSPSEEYPFAFYPGDGTLSIYGEFDSIYFFDREEYHYKTNPTEEENKTILCKAAKNNVLKDIFITLYMNRRQFPTNKDCMNMFIGFCQVNSCPLYAHISAVTIARSNNRMLQICDKLRERNQIPVLVNTDSVAWIGQPQPDIETKEKGFGKFVVEHENVKAIICGPKKYQILQSDGITKNVWSGIPMKDSTSMEFGEMLIKDRPMQMYFFDETCNRFRIVYTDQWGLERVGEIL